MKILYLITARGGSKGLPGKNVRELAGKPLIAYTIEMAKAVATGEDEICVSTDSPVIAEISTACGIEVPFLRPEILAADNASSYDVILHAIDFYEQQGKMFDMVMLLQPTSPFRNRRQIYEVKDLMQQKAETEMVVSVKESKDNPYYNLFEEDERGLLNKSKPGYYTRRQDCPKVYAYNGSLYLMKVDALKAKPMHQLDKVVKYLMSEIYSLDIDSFGDWDVAEYHVKHRLIYEQPDFLLI
ncbi:N-acylneuraminate cytidylyltransferase [Chitinophaga sp. YR573]|uniref:acylneuraminate cytidylyltransferase family protein n=1 Tax=Chitinophaga sp. YR573 TaxID=1881040 RepID=UPI0008B0FF99|nr:acylneuraminate cytidylyltransferase family protein [Chitinophaga sp. YR573]SEW44471.1 N-acylneuraminate cytidylyltransferase [Chitinophaga sp. YR573]